MKRIVAALVLVVIGLVVWQLLQHDPAAPESSPSPSGTVVFAPGDAPTHTAPASTAAASPSASPTGLAGDELAKAWLTAYYTRAHIDDTNWCDAISPWTTPELVDSLRQANPDVIGLGEFSDIRVVSIQPLQLPNQPANTPTRTTSSWVVDLTDSRGHHAKRPMQVMSYLGPGGAWVVSHVDHLPVSDG